MGNEEFGFLKLHKKIAKTDSYDFLRFVGVKELFARWSFNGKWTKGFVMVVSKLTVVTGGFGGLRGWFCLLRFSWVEAVRKIKCR
jgi:hypothetical protein